MKKVTVVVPMADASPAIAPLVQSLDDQTLATTEFETIFVLAARNPVAGRLSLLERNRPNVIVHRTGAVGSAALLEAAEIGSGEFVLSVEPSRQLFPGSLEKLYGHAVSTKADIVSGRPQGLRPPNFNPDLFATNTGVLADSDKIEGALLSPAQLIRRTVLTERAAEAQPEPGANGSSLLEFYRGYRVSVYADYPAIKESKPTEGSSQTQSAAFQVKPASIEWRKGKLIIEASVMWPSEIDADVVFQGILRHASGLEFACPVDSTMTHGNAEILLKVDVDTAALGDRLEPGDWAVLLRPIGKGAAAPSDVPVRTELAPTAVIHGLLVATTRGTDGNLGLDINATKTPISTTLSPSDFSVVDDVRGALLRARLPGVSVWGKEAVDGHLSLDKLRLPAKLRSDGADIFVECFVSGLARSYALDLHFGGVRTATNLNLCFGGMGEISVVPRPKATKPGAKPSTAKPKLSQKAGKPANSKLPPKPPKGIAKLRRRLPHQLDPLATKVRRNRFARALYRRLSGL